MKKIKVWHVSDTHGFHKDLKIPNNIDIVIHSGDCSNSRESYKNEQEVKNFIEWYGSLDIPHKIYVAGNHCTSIERKLITPADFFVNGIIYLENSSTTVEGLKIWGSPITPSFGVGWAFNKDRGKIHQVWDLIPEDTDIIVTHGPVKGILDLSYNRDGEFEFCGCASLKRKILQVKPKLFCFGHIHNCEDILNAGYRKISGLDTIFSNGTVVVDGKFQYGAINNGNIFEL